ncbi:MAG: hypothetical protein ACYSSI_13400, partial [Planctomycetota bacterium]
FETGYFKSPLVLVKYSFLKPSTKTRQGWKKMLRKDFIPIPASSEGKRNLFIIFCWMVYRNSLD